MIPTLSGEKSNGESPDQNMVQSTDCRWCGSARVVPVLHRRMMGQATGGNPYREYCTDCEKFGPGVSRAFFKTHLRPHVLPKHLPVDNPDSVIPMHEWDGCDRFEAVKSRSADLAAYDPENERPFIATDANTFWCPSCRAFLVGHPDECGSCGQQFGWYNNE